jgi:hypothetical protein
MQYECRHGPDWTVLPLCVQYARTWFVHDQTQARDPSHLIVRSLLRCLARDYPNVQDHPTE